MKQVHVTTLEKVKALIEEIGEENAYSAIVEGLKSRASACGALTEAHSRVAIHSVLVVEAALEAMLARASDCDLPDLGLSLEVAIDARF